MSKYKMEDTQSKLDKIIQRLDNIEKILEEQGGVTKRMDNHIDMIENVYEKVKTPMTYVCDSINSRLIDI